MTIETLESGRDAVRRHDWKAAVDAFEAAAQQAGLGAEDLELEGEAAWWAGRPDAATDALERAFAAYLAAERPAEAAGVAMRLTYLAFRRVAPSIGAGWLAQAERLLQDLPESRFHAWLSFVRGAGAYVGGRLGDAAAAIDLAIELATKYGEEDAHALALTFKGSLAIARGQWEEGMALIDEAAAAASSGRIGVRVASDIHCNTIAACRDLCDYQRAAQWIDEAERWMRRESVGGYPGICRVHRAELKMLRGRWSEAEQEARLATQELELYRLMDGVGTAFYEVGEVRLRMGDLPAAAEAFDRAYEYGHDSQPGLALLQLAQGDADEAARTIARGLGTPPADTATDQIRRARLLPAQVEISLAGGDLETARSASAELEALATLFDRPAFAGSALTARGWTLLAEGEHGEAARVLDRAWRLWQELDMPYDSARARARYGMALLAAGETAAARRDLRSARATFERLGAAADLSQVDGLLGDEAVRREAQARVTKTFMFTDIVTSTDLIGLIGDASWEQLLRWHDRELRRSIAEHRGEEVQHTGDGFFVAFDGAGDAMECAVDIQRRLARHRAEHGFALLVRIGLHTAEATRQGGNYSGAGVHVAARVGAAAGGEDILVSAPLLAAVGTARFPLGEPRSVTLKGVKAPMEVRSVDWH